MIIVKEKSKITPLFIMRNDVENTTESGSGQYVTEAELNEQLSLKQDTLVSGANIKTINGDSIVGEGNLEITLGSIIGGAGINFDNYYTKTQVDELIDNVEVDLTDYYTKSEVNELLENVDADVDLSNYYNKGEVDILIDNSEQDITSKIEMDITSTLKTYATKIDVAMADNELQRQIDNLEDYVDNKVDNIVIPDSSNIVSLTTAKYEDLVNSGEVDSDTMYLITDAEISANFKTINGESILGDGNIEITGGGSVDLSDYYTKTEIDGKGYATESWVNTQIGNINNALENLIG